MDDAESIRTIHRAIDLGVTPIDTAEAYAQGHAEQVVGWEIAGHRAALVIADKVAPHQLRPAISARRSMGHAAALAPTILSGPVHLCYGGRHTVIAVTNAKVSGFVPQWATFRGFSILFDNPGDSLHATNGLDSLVCDVDRDPALGFYRNLRDALARLDVRLLTHTYLFCPLPSTSYHVTVWDGANDGNVGKIAAPQRETITQLLTDVPAALRTPHDLIRVVRLSPLVVRHDWNLSFRFSRLSLVGGSVLVAELDPATPDDTERLQELIHERSALSAHIEATYGFSPYHRYWPHVSLGYFANYELAQRAAPLVEQWNATFMQRLDGQTVTFISARVYGFNDMATFFICEG